MRNFLDLVSAWSSSWQTANAWVGEVVWWTSTFIHELSYLGPFVSVSSCWHCSNNEHCAYCLPGAP